MFKTLVVILSVLALAWSQTTPVSQCIFFNAPLPINTYIEDCPSPPCVLPQLQNVVLHIIFRAPYTMRTMRTVASAYLWGIPIGVPHDLQEQAVTCNFLTNTYCPVLQDEVITYTLKMCIESSFPIGTSATIEFRINDDNNRPVMCLRVPLRIVSPVTSASVIEGKYRTTMSLVAQAFEASKIVPDVIPTAPALNIELNYPSGAVASLGNELAPTVVKDQPSVSFQAEDDAYYTLVFTDPDNYDGPEKVYREWHHWLVGNIPGGDVSKGEVLSGYIGSGPPEGTGIHRYVYILYKQPGKLEFDEQRLTNKSIDGRAAFSTAKFAEKYNLGAPVAGNFYRAQFDDYVPLLYKSLGV